MTDIFSPSLEKRKAVAENVGKACREVGFFYALNHNIPDETINKTFTAIAEWFKQLVDVKMETHIHNNKNFRGYEPLLETRLDPTSRGGMASSLPMTKNKLNHPAVDLKEAFMMGESVSDPEQTDHSTTSTATNQWPSPTTAANRNIRPAAYSYYNAMKGFSRALLHTFALALDLPEDYFDFAATFPKANLRSLHYPPQEASTDVGIGAHTDYSWFTLVCQGDVGGLEVLNANGIWVPADPKPRSFVCNVGDFFSEATAGQFKSTVHRVLNKTGKERYSLPFFFAPNEDAVMSVVPGCMEEGKEYPDLVVKEYFHKRIAAARMKHPDGKEPEKRADSVVGEAPDAVTAEA